MRGPKRERAPLAADDGEQLLERIGHLRAVLPVFAQELMAARREAELLRGERRRLIVEVRRLQRERGGSRPLATAATGAARPRSTLAG